MSLEVIYNFDELIPVIDGHPVKGMLLYGSATLASAEFEGDPHAFYVKSIELDGGYGMTETGVGHGSMGFPRPLARILFPIIAKIIESPDTAHGKHAQDEFSAAVEGVSQPDPDQHRIERRERRQEHCHA